jgi:hypothetical protein
MKDIELARINNNIERLRLDLLRVEGKLDVILAYRTPTIDAIGGKYEKSKTLELLEEVMVPHGRETDGEGGSYDRVLGR